MSATELPPVSEWPKTIDGVGYLVLFREVSGPHFREHGFILEGSWDVNLGYIWEGGDGYSRSYDSWDDIVRDGWEID